MTDFLSGNIPLCDNLSMKDFETILTTLNQILNPQSNKKVLDKDIATALKIKPTTLASYKRRDTPPYKAMLTYCHDNRLDVRKKCCLMM